MMKPLSNAPIHLGMLVAACLLVAASNLYQIHSFQLVSRCDCNPLGSETTTECDRLTGQCQCKNANIIGLKCDKCRENYHDLAGGCRECDKCYQIVQLGVDHHRKELAELENMIRNIERSPEVVNDETFNKKLVDLLNRIKGLLQRAETAKRQESGLLRQFELLLARMAEIRATAKGINSNLDKTRPFLADATNNVTISEQLLRQILEAARNAENQIVEEGGLALLNARKRAENFGKQSDKMTEMAKESRQLADQHERDAARMRDLTRAAINDTNEATILAKNAAIAQEANAQNIANLKKLIEEMTELLLKSQKLAMDASLEAKKSYEEALALYTLINSLLIKNIDTPRIRQQAEEHLRNAQRLKTEIEEFIKRHAQLLNSTQFKLNEMRALLEEAIRQQQITDSQLADLDKTMEEAKGAVKKGDKILKEAQDMLATLLKFDEQVQESQKKAQEALKKIPAIRQMIKQAEDKTHDLASKLDTALADATDARNIAHQAYLLANETSSEAKKIRTDSQELKGRVTVLKSQSNELQDNIKQTANNMDKYEQLAKTHGEFALLNLERANQAASSARNASDTAKALLEVLNPILKGINKIEGIDGSKLAQLEDELAKLKQKLADSNLTSIIDELLAQREKQKALMEQYKAMFEWLRRQINNISHINGTLPDGCYKRNRLEVPIHEN